MTSDEIQAIGWIRGWASGNLNIVSLVECMKLTSEEWSKIRLVIKRYVKGGVFSKAAFDKIDKHYGISDTI